MTEIRVLVVDDDREMRASLVDLIEAAGFQVKALARAADVARTLPEFNPDVVLSDVRMPGVSGLDLLDRLTGPTAPPVVLISAHGDIATAVDAMTNGAYSFVEKPFAPRRLLTILEHAADQHRMRLTNARLRARLLHLSGLDRLLLGESPAIARLREDIVALADSGAAVLIQGETGCGKDLVARALHDLGPAGDGPFVPVNAAQLRAEHVTRIIRSANGGTLFLDEVLACPRDVQAMLLRVIDEKELSDPYTLQPERIDMRVLSSTNDDVASAVEAGDLRKDLMFRLSTTTLHIPPLRERREDVTLLTTHFLTDLARTYEVAPPGLTETDLAALIAHDWPGNVRELRNVVERRILLARRGIGSMAEAIHAQDSGSDVPPTLREAVAAFEREMIGKAIQAHDGRMEAVAEALGIGRRTLNEKIVKLGLDKDAFL